MDARQPKKGGPAATRRSVLAGLAAGIGAAAALRAPGAVQAQAKSAAKPGPILFKRTAETERYYKTLK